MIVAIDGPAGSGKSTIAYEVARRLKLTYVDTGAMYRALTLVALQRGLPLDDGTALGVLARGVDLRFAPGEGGEERMLADGRDVTDEIRTPLVSQKVSIVAAHPSVRKVLTARQRELADAGDAVLEGRDTGTVVCPGADVKVYLTASPEERARRRQQQLHDQGIELSLLTLERELLLRDCRDSSRAVAPLRKARDAIEVDTTRLSVAEVVDMVCAAARDRSGTNEDSC